VPYGAAVQRLLVAGVLAAVILGAAPPRAAPYASGLTGRQAGRVVEDGTPPRAPGARGELRTVPVEGPAARSSVSGLRVAVAVEGGLRISPQRFARTVARVLRDPRGWKRAGYAFRRVGGATDIEIVLASPATTDHLCAPLATLGRYSCAQGARAVLNFRRWRRGAPSYASLARYRTYMINHELGHLLGRPHAFCPTAGARAPVMVQQTKGVAPCRPNPWPLAGE
jgi:hypothetical protein